MNRRRFLARSGLTTAALLGARIETSYAANLARPAHSGEAEELVADVVILGGGTGGCAAALAACRVGLRVVMTEETDWIGGQLTQQAVPPDEHRLIEQVGCTATYRDFRNRVRDYYRRNYPLTAEARARTNLNPGNGSVSRICHEPRVSLAVLGEMLAPYVSARRLTVLLHHKSTAAEVVGERVTAVMARSLETGKDLILSAPFYLDATELGDLLPLTKTEYVTGAEAQRDTGEPHAPAEAQPLNMQAASCCFALDYVDEADLTIPKPREYDFWREYGPGLVPPWPGRMLSLKATHPISLQDVEHHFDPKGSPAHGRVDLWRFRRIADRTICLPGADESDITLVNWPQMDYVEGPLCEVPEEEVKKHIERAKQQSLSLLYWLQTEAPRPDGKTGWRGLRLRKDVVGTGDGLAKYPYIRESRRIKALFTVVEQHVGTESRMQITGKPREEAQAESFPDSIGVGSYRIDLHPSTGRNNYIDISSLPFQIPLGALIPQRTENLLAACKNIGVTHITNGCYRLHPVEWNIGEAAGALVAFCLRKKKTPRAVHATSADVTEFQRMLQSSGVETDWPRLRPT